MSADLTLAQGLATTALTSASRSADRRICALITRLDLTEADHVPIAEMVQLLNELRSDIDRDVAKLIRVVKE